MDGGVGAECSKKVGEEGSVCRHVCCLIECGFRVLGVGSRLDFGERDLWSGWRLFLPFALLKLHKGVGIERLGRKRLLITKVELQ